MNVTKIALSLVIGTLIAACGDRPSATSAPSPQASTPMAAAPAPAPPASPIPPAATAPAAPGATAQDTPMNNPMGTVTKEEESSTMPKAGQANNHSSPSLEKAKSP